MAYIALLIIICLIISYFLWILIHEMSHVTAAAITVGIEWFQIKIFPHKYKNSFRFAGCLYLSKREMTKEEYGFVSLAPRIPNLIAAVMLPLIGFFDTGVFYYIWSVFWACGLIDFFVGSLGISKYSDLKRAAVCFDISPWVLRIFGFSVIMVSVFIAIIDMVIKF